MLLSGNEVPEPIISSGNSILIQFNSNSNSNSKVKSGFTAIWNSSKNIIKNFIALNYDYI